MAIKCFLKTLMTMRVMRAAIVIEKKITCFFLKCRHLHIPHETLKKACYCLTAEVITTNKI